MAVTLNNGEIVNQCDAATGFITGTANTDIFAEPTASIGAKVSQTTVDFYTTTLGATAPYDFSSGGGEFGQHIIVWLNVLGTPNATDGGRIIVGNGVSRGVWYVPFPSGYTGGFQPRVINTAANFDVISAGTWTLTGNPAQLTNVTTMGGGFNVTSKVSGNFSNVGVDIFTIGTGLRADGTGNTLETFLTADAGGTIWGWMTSAVGSYVSRGGLYLGPSSGAATSSFSETGQVLVFASERVATGFYVISIRGSNTTADFENCVIRAEDTAVARWGITIDGTSIPTFTANGGLFSGFDTITLRSTCTLTGVTLDDGNDIVQNGASLDSCIIKNANTTDGTALILSNDPFLISNCEFVFSDGHAIELTSATSGNSYTFTGNVFTGYGTTGSNDAAIYNNSGGAVTLNVSGATSPTYRNGTGASTTINNTVNVTLTGLRDNTEIRVYEEGTNTIVGGIENATNGTTDDRSFTFSDAPADVVDIIIMNITYKYIKIPSFEIPSENSSIPIQQEFDRNYSNA